MLRNNKQMKRIFKILCILIIPVIIQFCVKDEIFPPIAKFSILPSVGNTQSNYIFNASESRDANNSQEIINIRWDWENDGIWDTPFSSDFIQQHQYDQQGIYTIKLEVKDSNDESSFLTRDIHVTNAGPLGSPEIICPEVDGKNLSLSTFLKWKCFHYEDSIIKYDIYFGDRTNPPLIKSNYISTIFDPGLLRSNTFYYWKIVAKDKSGNTTSTSVNSFYTHLLDNRDEKTYDIFIVENNFWMAENLNYEPKSDWYYAGNDPGSREKYGLLYNWNSADRSCPEGWHVPTDLEWKLFETSMFLLDVEDWGPRGSNQGDMIKAGGSTDFNAIMAGTKNETGDFSNIGFDTGFWAATDGDELIYYRYLIYNMPYIFRSAIPAKSALSVRCALDED